MNNKNEIIEKVEKLMTMANDKGASQGEIENALKLANKLMSKYQLSSDDILLGYSDVDSSAIFADKQTGEVGSWRWDLMHVIAKGNLCTTHARKSYKQVACKVRGWDSWKNVCDGYTVTLVGSDLNRRIVTEMYKLCIERLPQLAEQRWKERCKEVIDQFQPLNPNIKLTVGILVKHNYLPPKNRFINSYYKGAIRGIRIKLAENVKELAQDEFHKWGLMVVKNDTLLQQHIEDTVGELGTEKSRKVIVDGDAVKKGMEDAKHLDQKQLNAQNI